MIFDAGTTTEFVARYLDAADVTVFTNGIGAVNVFLGKEDVSVVVLGGHLRTVNQTISGPEAERAPFGRRGLRVHRRRRGAPAVRRRVADPRAEPAQDPDDAAGAPDRGGRRSAQGHTDQFNYWSPTPARWRLITDDEADPAALDELRKTGAQVELAQPLRALTETANVKGNQP